MVATDVEKLCFHAELEALTPVFSPGRSVFFDILTLTRQNEARKTRNPRKQRGLQDGTTSLLQPGRRVRPSVLQNGTNGGALQGTLTSSREWTREAPLSLEIDETASVRL